MAALGAFYQGESISIGFNFVEYDIMRIQEHYVYLKKEIIPSQIINNLLRIELSSIDTKDYLGDYPILLVWKDPTFGMRKKNIGSIYFNPTTTISEDAINQSYNIIINLQIADKTITVDRVILEVFRGYSAYDIYLQHTEDDPPMSEVEWSNFVNTGRTVYDITSLGQSHDVNSKTEVYNANTIDHIYNLVQNIENHSGSLDNLKVQYINGNPLNIQLTRNDINEDVIISLRLEDVTAQTIEQGHIAILSNDEGELHGEMYWGE